MAYSQWLPRSRRGGGEYNTQNFTVPTGIETVRLRLDVALADFTTPDLSVTITIQISTDNAQTWRDEMSVGWIGSVPTPRPGVPFFWAAAITGISQYAGQLVRVHFSTSGSFRWGLQGEII